MLKACERPCWKQHENGYSHVPHVLVVGHSTCEVCRDGDCEEGREWEGVAEEERWGANEGAVKRLRRVGGARGRQPEVGRGWGVVRGATKGWKGNCGGCQRWRRPELRVVGS
ncbi:hypothetical protein LOK49_LG05G00024 [Camellia lanceoleosa]|uniref:Uncharacterized protein n=1 Tax=Camellia lanceoleosa TaxID=1840588 RepID=A0ACC0HN62_9ERIC|nr:hypothetical protein LOK49_LG05G00024 [Camellia lanceoleosa]